MTAYYFWFGVFIFFFYLVATDDSVAYALTLVSKIMRFQYQKYKWWLWNNPQNIIVRWMMYRKSMKMAEELMKEFEEKNGLWEEH